MQSYNVQRRISGTLRDRKSFEDTAQTWAHPCLRIMLSSGVLLSQPHPHTHNLTGSIGVGCSWTSRSREIFCKEVRSC